MVDTVFMPELLMDTATYWAPSGVGAYAAPAAIDCHWEDVAELAIDAQGREFTSQARVIIGADVAVGGWLGFGDLTAGSPAPGTLAVGGAFPVRKVEKIRGVGDGMCVRMATL